MLPRSVAFSFSIADDNEFVIPARCSIGFVMAFAARPHTQWQLRTRALALGRQTRVLGIVNCTPDSFSGDGLRDLGVEAAVAHGLRLLDDGADGLDLGGESTRPGSGAASSSAVSLAEEQDRVLPVIEALLREREDLLLSIDTYHAATARAAVAAGVEIVNDVSGFLWDATMAETCAALQCGVVLMHTRGRPDEWRTLPPVADAEVLPLIRSGFAERLAAAESAGVMRERIVLDPGYGFGKIFEANYTLLAGQSELLALGRPLLAGPSRKSFLGRTLARRLRLDDVVPGERDTASVAAGVAAILNGASILRVHAVKPSVEAAAIADAILAASEMRTGG
jgi:dihydropteroate synthase